VSIERNIKINVSGGDTTGTANLLKLNNAVKAVAMGYAALRAAQKAAEFVQLGAQVQAAEYRFVKFAGGTEEATKYLAALAAGTDYTIDRLTAMQQASRMLETGMASNAYEMELAGAIVAKLGNQTLSTERRMMSLTMLLANQSILRLDDFGISAAKVTARQRELEQQGVATSDAFRQAFFEIAAKQLGTLGDQSQTAATKISATSAKWKDFTLNLSEAAVKLALNIGLLDGLLTVTKNLAHFTAGPAEQATDEWVAAEQIRIDVMRESGMTGAQAAADIAQAHLDAAIALRAYWVEQNAINQGNEIAQYGYALVTEAVTSSIPAWAASHEATMNYVQSLNDATAESQMYINVAHALEDAQQDVRQAMLDTAAAMLDQAMAYSAYYQQVGQAAATHYGTMGDIEERYQDRVAQIQGMGAGDLGGGGAAPGREFDRADIERGLRIQKAQLAEAEAKQEGWDMGEKLEGMSWEDISREDRKWLTEHGKTLEDLQAEHVKTGEDITELERAQMDDRIEDLKGEIEETERILKQGHYDQHVMRIAAAKVDTAALLAEAAIRRDEEVAILEGSRIQQEVINQQSLGRLELANFDSWVARNIDTETATAEELRQVELMRLDIALKYGLITADTLTNTTDQWAYWDTLFLNIKTGADTAKTAVDNLVNAIKSLPSSGDVYWGGILPPGTIEGQQSGGPVLGGRPYLVGEQGPELFMPRTAGYIYNAQQSRQISNQWGGNTEIYHVTDERAWRLIQEEKRAKRRAAFTESSGMS